MQPLHEACEEAARDCWVAQLIVRTVRNAGVAADEAVSVAADQVLLGAVIRRVAADTTLDAARQLAWLVGPEPPALIRQVVEVISRENAGPQHPHIVIMEPPESPTPSRDVSPSCGEKRVV